MSTSRYPVYLCLLCAIVCVLLAPSPWSLRAQQKKPATISYEGQKVTSVDVAGRPDLNVRQLRQLITQPVNAPYSQQKIDESTAALKKAGQFQDVQLEVHPSTTGLQDGLPVGHPGIVLLFSPRTC